MRLRHRRVQIKTPDQIAVMRRAGLVVGETLAMLRATTRAGMTTGEVDAIAEDAIRSAGAVPSFQGYHGFPGSICASINDEVVHGIPGDRILVEGDVVSIDCGAIVEGWHGDAALTFVLGEASAQVAELLRVTEESMWRGIGAARQGGRVSDIGHAVEQYVDACGDYGIVEEFTGHGIGTEMHQDPDVPNFGRAGRGAKLVTGIALAVEPMITLGSPNTRTLADDWTVVSADGSVAAHFEHSFALTDRGVWVLTALDGGETELARLGVPFGG
ncbi:type I methionyl aminopeptidase [Nocardioides salsibiostraticola]